MLSIYPACFYREETGYSVIFPDLNYLATCGDDLEEAMAMAVDCLAGYLFSCQRDGDNIPPPSAMDDIDPLALNEELDPGVCWGKSWVNLVAVDVASYARDHFEVNLRSKIAEPLG